ncbi:hypothetical protein EXIGLDRAFT_767304 [Exidia glandulosa HHB12029]|uniref:Uncharacterized protein n=1 Tax=Exidia glandulosa HHB12029 TaxID=1314781 RepID=A0A165J2P0_EXIGL|nr:hypothetical protein EXIGLDRAFT_767304 [Exidia glandulosa HHB12029]
MSMTYEDWVNKLPVADEDNSLRLLQVGQQGEPAWPSFDGAMPNSPLPHGVERVIHGVEHPSLKHTLNRLFVFRPYPYLVGRIDAIFNSVSHHQRYSIILTGTPGIGALARSSAMCNT